MEERFSKRLGYNAKEKEITIREDAPDSLRAYITMLMYDLGLKPSDLRKVVCKILKVAPDTQGNWTEFPNIEYEVVELLKKCEWFFIYDVIEAFYSKASALNKQDTFEEEINDFFRMNGIGWKLAKGRIIVRGDETFEKSVTKVITVFGRRRFTYSKN